MRTNKNKGQLIIITLLLMATFALIGASVATQMVFEQRKATLEDKTQKAYYAAESGIEKAIQNLELQVPVPGQMSVGQATVDLSTTAAGNSQNFSLPGVTLNPGQPLYLNLAGYATNTLYICWPNALSSIQATLVYTETGVSRMTHYAFNADPPATPSISGGTTATFGNGCGSSNVYVATVDLPAGVYDYMTIIPMYASTGILVGASGINNLPSQGTEISSTAQVPELDTNITRRVKYFYSSVRYPPYYLLYSFFSGGGVSYGPGRNW